MIFATTNVIFDLGENHQHMLTLLSEMFILQTNTATIGQTDIKCFLIH